MRRTVNSIYRERERFRVCGGKNKDGDWPEIYSRVLRKVLKTISGPYF